MAGTFDVVARGTYTVPASGDTNAIASVQAQLTSEFGSIATVEVSAVVSPVQAIPGSTTYDVTIEFVVQHPALSLADSITKTSFKDLATALLKAGKVKGSQEHTEQG